MPKGRKHQPNHFINFSPSAGHEQKAVLFARVSLFSCLFLLINKSPDGAINRVSSVLSISRFQVISSAAEWACLSRRSRPKKQAVFISWRVEMLSLWRKIDWRWLGEKEDFEGAPPRGRSPYPHPTAVRVRCGHCSLLNQKKYPVNLRTLRQDQFFTSPQMSKTEIKDLQIFESSGNFTWSSCLQLLNFNFTIIFLTPKLEIFGELHKLWIITWFFTLAMNRNTQIELLSL